MDTEAMFYVFGPMVVLSIGYAIAWGAWSYHCFKRGEH